MGSLWSMHRCEWARISAVKVRDPGYGNPPDSPQTYFGVGSRRWHPLTNRSAVFFRGLQQERGQEGWGGLVLSGLVMASAIQGETGPVIEIRSPSTNSSLSQIEFRNNIKFGKLGSLVDEGSFGDQKTIIRAFRGLADRG